MTFLALAAIALHGMPGAVSCHLVENGGFSPSGHFA